MRSDEHDGGEVAAAVAPSEICTGLTLFQIGEGIDLVAESAEEEGLTPEIERALTFPLKIGGLNFIDSVTPGCRSVQERTKIYSHRNVGF
jgi:hypothetical protein